MHALLVISRLRDTGMPLAEIRKFMQASGAALVDTRLGPGRRYPDSHTSVSMVLPHRTTNEIVEVRTYHTPPWYSRRERRVWLPRWGSWRVQRA